MCKVVLAVALSLFVASASFAQWSADPGVNNLVFTSTTYDTYQTRVVSDGAGGAIIGWIELNPAGVHIQRIDFAGYTRWPANGVIISGTDTVGAELTVVAEGAIVVWRQQTATGAVITRSKLNASIRWVLCSGQQFAVAVADGAGGAIVAREEHRTISDDWARAQHINARV